MTNAEPVLDMVLFVAALLVSGALGWVLLVPVLEFGRRAWRQASALVAARRERRAAAAAHQVAQVHLRVCPRCLGTRCARYCATCGEAVDLSLPLRRSRANA